MGPFSKNYRTFYQKNCQKALKNLVLGSGIRKKPIPDPGSRGQKAPDPGSRIPDPDPQHCSEHHLPQCQALGTSSPPTSMSYSNQFNHLPQCQTLTSSPPTSMLYSDHHLPECQTLTNSPLTQMSDSDHHLTQCRTLTTTYLNARL